MSSKYQTGVLHKVLNPVFTLLDENNATKNNLISTNKLCVETQTNPTCAPPSNEPPLQEEADDTTSVEDEQDSEIYNELMDGVYECEKLMDECLQSDISKPCETEHTKDKCNKASKPLPTFTVSPSKPVEKVLTFTKSKKRKHTALITEKSRRERPINANLKPLTYRKRSHERASTSTNSLSYTNKSRVHVSHNKPHRFSNDNNRPRMVTASYPSVQQLRDSCEKYYNDEHYKLTVNNVISNVARQWVEYPKYGKEWIVTKMPEDFVKRRKIEKQGREKDDIIQSYYSHNNIPYDRRMYSFYKHYHIPRHMQKPLTIHVQKGGLDRGVYDQILVGGITSSGDVCYGPVNFFVDNYNIPRKPKAYKVGEVFVSYPRKDAKIPNIPPCYFMVLKEALSNKMDMMIATDVLRRVRDFMYQYETYTMSTPLFGNTKDQIPIQSSLQMFYNLFNHFCTVTIWVLEDKCKSIGDAYLEKIHKRHLEMEIKCNNYK